MGCEGWPDWGPAQLPGMDMQGHGLGLKHAGRQSCPQGLMQVHCS